MMNSVILSLSKDQLGRPFIPKLQLRTPKAANFETGEDRPRQIEIKISGAIKNPGTHRLTTSKVMDALLSAGGLVRKGPIPSSGILTIRRPLEGREVCVWMFRVNPLSKALKAFDLQTGDLLIFQHQITNKDSGAKI